MIEERQNGQWLKLLDAAQVLGVSEITLRRKIKNGKLTHDFRDGKYFIYLLKDPQNGSYFEPHQVNSAKPFHSISEYYPKQPTLGIHRETPFHQAPRAHSDAENRMARMQKSIEEKDSIIQKLQREFEDQLTLIAFLEETIRNIGNSKAAHSEQPHSKIRR